MLQIPETVKKINGPYCKLSDVIGYLKNSISIE